ncbi:MAG TPA: OmpH family outer membrane protein, partial [Gemmatimonadales bacterium]|nr:OmpH family outer membrane protein [Gemmatimonadales bacterium]
MSKRSPFHFLLPAAVLALGAAPANITAQGGTNGIAYVAVQAVLQKTPGYTAAENTWNQEFEGYQRDMAQIQSRMDSATAAFEQQAVMLSPSNRAAERKKLEDQAAELQQRVAELRQKMQDRQRQLLDPIEERVIAVIEGLRAEGNYALVLDVSSQYNAVVAADKARDL